MKNEQTDFEEDLVRKAIGDVLENHLENNNQVNSYFMADNIDALTQNITNEIMKELLKTRKLFKYSITTFIQQKCGAAVNFGCSIFAEDSSDGIVTARKSNDYIDIIISVVGVKITQK